MRPAGGNHATLRKYAQRRGISTHHFDPYRAARMKAGRWDIRPLEEVLVERSSYSRGHLKRRLFQENLKQRVCELCGQDEVWRGRRMSLILDHMNGVATDHRLENLQIVCPNCAATLDTHCGRNSELHHDRACARCGKLFSPGFVGQRHCSLWCGQRRRRPYERRLAIRKVERPSHEQLLADLAHMSYVGVGRKYGVTDNAVRKRLRWYERERELADACKSA
jgi:hypothetical protein